LSSTRPVESKRANDVDRERQHGGFRVGFLEERIVDLRCRTNRTNELDLSRTQLREDGFHVRGLHRRLEVIEQYVVRMLGGWEKRDVASSQRDDLFQVRPE